MNQDDQKMKSPASSLSGPGFPFPAALFEATSDCVFVLDANWRFIYFNVKAMTELNAGNLQGTIVWKAFPKTMGSKFEEVYRRVALLKKSETFEAYYPQPLDRWYEVHAVPCRSAVVVFFRNITRRRVAVQALLRRHDELDAVLSRAGVGIMQYTADHRLVIINEQSCQILGRTREELDGLPMEAFTHPDDIPRNAGLLKQHRESGTPLHIQKRFVRPDGEIIWCSVTISFVRHSETNESTTIVVARDVGHEREVLRRIEDTQALLQAVVDSAEDLIYVKDTEGRFVLANKKLERDFRIAAGQSGAEHFPELSERFLAEDLQVIRSGERLVLEEQIPMAGGLATFQTIKVRWQQAGKTKGVIGISRDITDRVRNEQALRESEERYRLAALATRDAIWEWDLKTGTIAWSGSASNLTGEMPGISFNWWCERVHPDDREAIASSIDAFVTSGNARWEGEYRFRRLDGSFGNVLDRAFLIRDDTGHPVRMIGAMADITERVEAQARINRLQADLVHVSRVSAMGTMGATLAHEINQPLAAVGNYLSGIRHLIASDQPDISKVEAALDQAQSEVARAAEIIRGLRRMVKGGQADTRAVMLIACIREAQALAIPDAAEAGITVSLDVPSHLIAMADPIQLQQILINLIRNSAEALAHAKEKRIHISARARDDEIVIRVSDTGEGLKDNVRPRLFSAFSSTKAGGLGLGLSICRTIVEAHGGKIWVEDPRGCDGAIFAFTMRSADAGRIIPAEED